MWWVSPVGVLVTVNDIVKYHRNVISNGASYEERGVGYREKALRT